MYVNPSQASTYSTPSAAAEEVLRRRTPEEHQAAIDRAVDRHATHVVATFIAAAP
ncbi:MAG: hypothetical protein OES24_16280 [Acidimicrobiia bacterium]|nr:hypothetical protein [Acidimicrobiia bacterium]